MFPKGPRFVTPNIPDHPGPGAYNIVAESQLDAYKRGAFLEKADRFRKDKPTEGPGHAHDNRPSTAMSTTADRYAVLQRKLDDLERLHAQSKKSSQADIDRLKHDLNRLQKQCAEQTDRLEKQRKTNDALETRVAELKKAASNDQTEIRDLRSKLRMAEAADTKAAEAKRREEGRERDKKMGELEKAMASERRIRRSLEAQLEEMKTKSGEELSKARSRADRLQEQVEAAQTATQDARTSNEISQTMQKELLAQLEQHRNLLSHVAQEYGNLASSTVSSTVHAQVKEEHMGLRVHVWRLERKLANAEAQAVELANLARCYAEEKECADKMVKSQLEEAHFRMSVLEDRVGEQITGDRLEEDVARTEVELLIEAADLHSSRARELGASEEFYRLECDELASECILANKIATVDSAIAAQASAELAEALANQDGLVARLEAASMVRDETEAKIAKATEKLAGAEKRLAEEECLRAEAVQKEREAVQRLTATIQKSKVVEDGLRAEVEQLTSELRDVERFQTAYYSLSDEVEALLARNTLAEEEAERLSRFNAEILGHHNPAQRILYVERIRRELAETQQRLLVATKRKEAVEVGNQELRHELDMYRSITLPAESKARATITRIGRAPLAPQSLNTWVDGGSGEAQISMHKVIPGGGATTMSLSELV